MCAWHGREYVAMMSLYEEDVVIMMYFSGIWMALVKWAVVGEKICRGIKEHGV